MKTKTNMNERILALATGGFALLAATGALAEPTGSPQVTVSGNAPAGCALGGWQLDSGPAQSFAGGMSAVFVYDPSVMTTQAVSQFNGSNGKIVAHAPLTCNAPVTWSLGEQKGALALDTPPANVPAGFSTEWTYELVAAPQDGSHAPIFGRTENFAGQGTPLPVGEVTSSLTTQSGWGPLRFFGFTFTPDAVSVANNKMVAGHYSEVITLQVQPAF